MSERTAAEQALRAALRTTRRLPDALRRAIAGVPPENDRGAALDLDLHWMLWLERTLRSPSRLGDIQSVRKRMRSSVRMTECPLAEVDRVESASLGGREVKVFFAQRAQAPALLAVHGGGWTTGGLRSHEALWRRLCVELDCTVVALDYRLAPEHPFPAGLDDVLSAWRALQGQAQAWGVDPARIGIGGDSAGGNLSAAACLALRDEGGPMPAFQLLIYPAVDLRCERPSHHLFAEGYVYPRADILWHLGHYGPPDPLAPLASPLLAARHDGLPPAVIATAGFDPLRDEGEAYALKLQTDGVDVVHLRAPDMVHGFVNLSGVSAGAERALSQLIGALAEAL